MDWDIAPLEMDDDDFGLSKEAVEDRQLLRLTIQQALQSQYVLEHTRGIDRFLSPHKESESDEKSMENTEDTEHTLATLVGKALEEAKNRHVTAGFSAILEKKKTVGDVTHFVTLMERLGRELSAIGLSADSSYLSLSNKRAVILDRIVNEYQKEYRIKGMASLKTKDLPDNSHSLLKVTVGSGVFMMLTMLENAAHSNPKMALKILNFLKLQLAGVDPCELATSLKLPIPEIAESSFDAVHETLMAIAFDSNVKLLLRTICLELLLQISVTRGTLNTLLSVIYLLLFKFDCSQVLSCRNSLVRLREMRREIRLDLPSYRNQLLKASIVDAIGNHTTMTTDGSYLYLHSSKGLFKIGTGLNNTSPGFVIGEIRGYRGSEKASLACVGDKLYFRSANIAPAKMIVLSTETLTEIGHILRNGKGSYPTVNNNNIQFGYVDFEEDKLGGNQLGLKELKELGLAGDKDDNKDNNENDDDENDEKSNGIAAIRAEIRVINQRMTQLDEMGMYDDDEMYELEDRYDTLMDSLPPEYQNGLLDIEDDGPLGIDPNALNNDSNNNNNNEEEEDDSDVTDEDDAPTTNALFNDPFSVLASQLDNKPGKKKKKKKKSPIPAYNPIVTDGRFLYAVVPVKPTKFEKKDEKKIENNDENNDETKDDSNTNTGTNRNNNNGPLMASNAIGSLLRERSESVGSTDDFGGDLGMRRTDSVGTNNNNNNEKKKKKKKEKQKITFVNLSVNAFDPESENKMEYCHSVMLKRPSPSDNDYVLDFHASDDAKKQQSKQDDDANYYGRRKKTSRQTQNTSCVDLGAPKHLQLGSSLTMEAWVKFGSGDSRRYSQYIFYKGDGSYFIYFYVQQNNIYCGYNGMMGSTSGYASTQVDLTQWTHLAATYDATEAMWRIYVNGSLANNSSYPGNRQCGPQANSNPWILGSTTNKAFFGEMCDARIWSVPRSEEQLKKGMKSKVSDIIKEDGLRGFWPLNDGLGLMVRDLSKYSHYGFVKDCQWKQDERPFSLKTNETKDSETLQIFHPSVANSAQFYTNGEVLVIAYAYHSFWNKMTYKGIAQKFNLETGVLSDELEYDEFGTLQSACFSKDWKSMWCYMKKYEGTASCHTMQAPSAISRWRKDRIKDEFLENETLQPKNLIDKYGLLGIDIFPEKERAEKLRKLRIERKKYEEKHGKKLDINNGASTLSPHASRTKETPEASPKANGLEASSTNSSTFDGAIAVANDNEEGMSEEKINESIIDNDNNNKNKNKVELNENVDATMALANIFLKLDHDCQSLRSVDTHQKVPMSLALPFGVDLNDRTFEKLIDIAEELAKEFYSNTDAKNSPKNGKNDNHNNNNNKSNDKPSGKNGKNDKNDKKTPKKNAPTNQGTKKKPNNNSKSTPGSEKKKGNGGTPGSSKKKGNGNGNNGKTVKKTGKPDTAVTTTKKSPSKRHLNVNTNNNNDASSESGDSILDFNENNIEITKTADQNIGLYLDNESIEETRMLCLLVIIRLLRTNIMHLTSWNVDPKSVGFSNKRKDEFGEIVKNSLTVRERYVILLNRLVFDRPQSKICKLIEDSLHSEVAECLSIGLSVFYQDPIDRVTILSDHVHGCLTESDKNPNPLRLLLASRYFASLTEAHNLIGLVPALIQLFRQGYKEKSLLLHSVLKLVFLDAKKALKLCIENPNDYINSHQNNEDSGSNNSGIDLIGTLRQFLARMQVCLFNTDLGKGQRKIYIEYAMPYGFEMIDLCCQLIDVINEEKLKNNKLELFVQATLVDIFQSRIGELLSPLISSLWGMHLKPKMASKVLPHINRLLNGLTRLMENLPDITKSEKEFRSGNYERIVVERREECESIHPVPRGTTEKLVSIPGAKQLKLTIDRQSFNSSSPGASLTLYRRQGQQDPIEGASFSSVPNKPVIVNGDTVYIAYNSGYQSNAWGFKVTVSATIEEVRYELPWILDLTKNVCLVASKCAGVFISAPPDKRIEIERNTYHWLKNDLLSQGFEYSLIEDKKERKILQWLPNDIKNDNNDEIPSSLPFNQKDSGFDSYINENLNKKYNNDGKINYLQIAKDLVPLLKNVTFQKFPTPDDVKDFVDESVTNVFSVLLKHNLLIHQSLRMLKDETSEVSKIPDGIIRVWKTAQKLRSWLRQKFQTEFAAKQAELQRKKKAYEEKKKGKKKKKNKNNGQPSSLAMAMAGISGIANNNNNNIADPSDENNARQEAERLRMEMEQMMGIQTLDEHGMPINQNTNANKDDDEKKIDSMPNDDIDNDEKEMKIPNENLPSNDNNNNNDKKEDKTEEEILMEKKKKAAGLSSEDKEAELLKKKKLAAMTPEQRKLAEQEEAAKAMNIDMKNVILRKPNESQEEPQGDMGTMASMASAGTMNSAATMASSGSMSSMGSASSPKKDDNNNDDISTKESARVRRAKQRAAKAELKAKAIAAALEEEEKKWEVNKNDLYKEICNEISKRCEFLLIVLAVPSSDARGENENDEDELNALGGPTGLVRTKSSDKDKDMMKAAAALTAWHATKEGASSLAMANTDQRYGLIWKLVLSFLDEKKIEINKLIEKVRQDRLRSRLRSFGFRVLRMFFECTTNYKSCQRELLHFLVPSLFNQSPNHAFSGETPSIFGGLSPVGYGLKLDLLDATQYLYSKLISILKEPKESGCHLLQASMYALMPVCRKQYDLIIKLGIFDALKALLNQNGNDVSVSINNKPGLEKTFTGGSTAGQNKDNDSSLAYQTSAWALLELLTTTLMTEKRASSLSNKNNNNNSDYLENVYGILLEQLDKISMIKQTKVKPYVPHLPPSSKLEFFNKKSSKENELLQRKVATVNQFGFAAAAASGANEDENETNTTDIGSSDNENVSSDEAFHVRVLNLIADLTTNSDSQLTDEENDENELKNESTLNIANNEKDAMHLFAEKRSLTALLRLLWTASPRTRIVTLRILRHVMSNKNCAPTGTMLDECVKAALGTTVISGVDESLFVTKILRDIGVSLLSPVIAAFFDGKVKAPNKESNEYELFKLFEALRLPNLYSGEYVMCCAEQVMFLRYLLSNGEGWNKLISQTVSKSLEYLPNMKNIDNSSINSKNFESIFTLIGALSVIGGFIDSIRVGTRVYYQPENVTCIVTSRNIAKNSLSLLREQEGSVIDRANVNEVISVGDVPFEPNVFDECINWSNIIKNLIVVLSNELPLHPKQNNNNIESKINEEDNKNDNINNGNKDYHNNISISDLLGFKIQSLCSMSLNGLLLDENMLLSFVKEYKSEGIKHLTKIAFNKCDLSCQVSTSVLQDRSHALTMECLRRGRLNKELSIELSHDTGLQLTVKEPKIEFSAEFTCFGKLLKKQTQGVTGLSESTKGRMRGLFNYIRLNEEPTIEKCKDKIVMIDTYGDFKPKLSKCKEFGAIACVLALHSKQAKDEDLHIKSDEDQATSKKPKRSGNDLIEMAAASALSTYDAFGQQQQLFGRGGFNSFSFSNTFGSGFGGPPAPQFAVSRVGLSRNQLNDNEDDDDVGSSLNKLGKLGMKGMIDEKKDEKQLKEELAQEAHIKELHIIAVNKAAAQILRILIGVKECDQPYNINHKMMINELTLKYGHSRELAERALKKNTILTVEAADAWIKQNLEWLEQPLDTDLQPMRRTSSVHADLNIPLRPDDILNDPKSLPNEWDLSKRWSKFEDAVLRQLQVTSGSRGSGSSPNGDVSNVDSEHSEEEPRYIDKEWYNIMYFQPTHELLYTIICTDHSLRVHSMRRSLLSIFLNVNINDLISDKSALEKVLNICLSLRPHPAMELIPLNHLRPIDVTGRLVRCIRQESESEIVISDNNVTEASDMRVKKMYSDTLMRSSQEILRSMCRGVELYGDNAMGVDANDPNDPTETVPSKDKEPKSKTLVVGVHGRTGGRYGGGWGDPTPDPSVQALKFVWGTNAPGGVGGPEVSDTNNTNMGNAAYAIGKKKLKVVVTADPTLTSMGTVYVSIFKDKTMKSLIARFTVTAFDFQKHVTIVESDTFYYTCLSSSWYNGCPPSNCIFTVLDLSDDHTISERSVLRGTTYSALVFVNSLLKSGSINLDLTLIQLLRSLEFAPDRQAAQCIARIATNIFNQWNTLPHIELENDNFDLETKIIECITKLERSHESLRTWTLTQWSSGSLPGPHIQTLLELLLAARSALGMTNDTEQENEIWTDVNVDASENELNVDASNGDISVLSKKDDKDSNNNSDEMKSDDATQKEYKDILINNYTKFRDGPSKCNVISLMYEKVMKSRTLNVTRDAHNRYMIDDFVADVCVRQGGKWYYEVKFSGNTQFACVGFVTRKYRKYSNSGISVDGTGNAWCVTAPNTQFMHRSRNMQPFMDNDEPFLRPNWNGNLVVGVKLNLDECTMEFTFNGETSGIAFQSFSVEDGFYPCVSLNQNTSCVLNLGDTKFDHPEPIEKDGYAPFESSQIKSSSWLRRYKIASDVTSILSQTRAVDSPSASGTVTPSNKDNQLVKLSTVELPDKVVDAALSNEASLDYSHELRFEVAKTNVMRGYGFDMLLEDSSTLFNSTKPNDTMITFKVSGYEPIEFVLRSVHVRCASGTNGFKAFVFISKTDPEFDSFDWCKHFTKAQFEAFNARRSKDTIRKPHEPVALLTSDQSGSSVKLNPPMRGKFVTLKIIANSPQNGLNLEHIKFDCIHGDHPLSNMIGTNEADAERERVLSELKKIIQTECGNWTLSMDEQLTELSQIVATRLGVNISNMDSVMLAPTDDELNRFKKLKGAFPKNEELQARFSIIKYLNKLVTPLLHYIDVTLFSDEDSVSSQNYYQLFLASGENDKSLTNNNNNNKNKNNNNNNTNDASNNISLSSQIHILKGCYFMSTKKSVFDTLLAGSGLGSQTVSNNRPRVTINRIKAAKAKEKKNDPNGLRSVFGQLFSQLRNTRYSSLRSNQVGAQLWSVIFSGEGSIDVGGPYRESLTNAVSDLQSKEDTVVPLFVLCPNGRNSVGLNREKFIINPSSNSSLHLAMYEFVGVLMGVALRTKQSLGFDFPSLIWKQILNEKIDISDLEAVDKLCVQALNELEKIDAKSFEYCVYETFTTQLSDGNTTVELKKDGKNINVTKDNYKEFVSLVIKKRLNESTQQVKAIKKGLNAVVPVRMLSLFSWYDLEILVCGNPNIDIETLRKHTVYQGGLTNSSNVVKHFWKTLYSFSQEERQLFLRFVWGRNRLPPTENDWDSNFTIKSLNTTEDSLPIAHTCFFSIDLPPYSTFKLCQSKLRFAIHNCQAIDVDFNPNSSSLQAWIDDY